jgi:hypothetical protein
MDLWLRSIKGTGPAHFFNDPSCAVSRIPAGGCGTIGKQRASTGRTITRARTETSSLSPSWSLSVHSCATLAPRTDASAGSRHLPHEGAVCAPAHDPRARSVARGRSVATGTEFDLIVAFERTLGEPWRAIAESPARSGSVPVATRNARGRREAATRQPSRLKFTGKLNHRVPPTRPSLPVRSPWRPRPRLRRYGDAGGSVIQKFHMPCVVMWVVESSPGLCCGLMPVVVQKITG